MRIIAILLMLMWAGLAQASGLTLMPYAANYTVRYGSMEVGSLQLKLAQQQGDRWTIESRTRAHGLARLVAGGTLVQHSTFLLQDGQVRPLRYRFDDGMERSRKDVALDFDWRAGRVSGTEEDNAPVSLATEAALQDAASLQVAVQAALLQGREPGTQRMIEKDKVKVYHYTRLREESLVTDIGTLETVVYSSRREKSDRETLLWYAPSLGYLNVQAEQRRGGKRTFATRITHYQP